MKAGGGGGLKEEKEDIEVIEIPFKQAMQMIDDGEIKDVKTITLMLYAQATAFLTSSNGKNV